MINALKAHKDDVGKTLLAIDRLKPDFGNAAIADLPIREQLKPIVETALEDAKLLLRSV